MNAHPTHTKSRRPLPLFLIAVLCLAVVVVVVVMAILYMPLPKHFPPEDPEITAKRLSPENGFYALEEAASMIKLVSHLDPGLNYWEQWPGFDWTWKSGWTEDIDKERLFVAYFEQASPALEKMREGLAADYYLLPEIGDMTMDMGYLSGWRELARVLAAQAKWYESQGKYDEAMNNYLCTARLGRVVGSDGLLVHGLVGSQVTPIGLEGMNSSVHSYHDPELLRNAVKTLKEIHENEAPLSTIFEFDFRALDKNIWSDHYEVGLQDYMQSPSYSNEIDAALGLVGYRINCLRFRLNSGAYWDEFLQVVDLPLLEFERRCPVTPGDPLSQILYPSSERGRTTFARKPAWLRGSILSLAVRLYRVEHGAYPVSLDALVPDYLEELLIDPFSSKPFVYSKAGDDFRLYSLGDDKDDDGGMPWQGENGDLIIHLPLDEWLGLEEAG